MPRGAPSWRGASADAPGSGDPGPPGVIVRAVRRNPDNASSRRVTPLILRGRKETGHPAPEPSQGPASHWLVTFRQAESGARMTGGNSLAIAAGTAHLSGMTPGARLAAAIDVLADIEARRRPAADALKDWGLAHRFAGSGDRAAIAGLVYDA